MAASTNPLARAIPAAELRWQSSMAAFAASDRDKAPASDGVLFVGSSTIRMWTDLAQDFRKQPVVINRGFGGSTMADCNYFVKQLVLQYKPRQVLVYAGDNDLAEGRTPEQVLESFQGFVRTVRSELPDTRIDYISIKPSPLRASLMPKVREANALLAAYLRTVPNAQYIDVFTPMLDATGAPRMELFGHDRLHMNEAGYDLWQSVIGAYVDAPNGSPADRPATLATSAPPAASTSAPVLTSSAAAATR
ncbi:SGNH/GDSL hydrolase family protein [Xylophilus ampelinus]|nr:SGNH/GDSL hydrolase family protein [Xylophilus ampelinus]MCS4509441.1 SGNH/GDSL hydrolase family protein [Xylophilus ampelinus]